MFGATDDELARLHALTAVFDEPTHRRLEGLGSLHGWTCLDVGAGSGTVSRWLAKRVGETGMVVACDRDTRFLDMQPTSQVQVKNVDITDNDVTMPMFDLVYARFVLAHLRQRDALVGRLASWVRPGGVLVLVDSADLGTPTSTYQPYRQTMQALWRFLAHAIGTDINFGLRHRAALSAVGLSNITMSVDLPTVSAHSPMSEFLIMTLSQALPRMITEGYLSAETARRALDYLRSEGLCDLSVAMVTTMGCAPVL